MQQRQEPFMQPFHDQIRDGRIDLLIFLMGQHSVPAPNYSKKLREKLATFEATTLDIIEASAEDGHVLDAATIIKSTEHAVREASFFLPWFTGDFSIYEAREITNGLHFLDRYQSVSRLEELTGTELDIAGAFLNVTLALYDYASADYVDITYNQNESAGYVKDPSLQDLIAIHYQQAETITRYIEERGSADPEALSEYLENSTALKGGVL
jgi:hypothetical protein